MGRRKGKKRGRVGKERRRGGEGRGEGKRTGNFAKVSVCGTTAAKDSNTDQVCASDDNLDTWHNSVDGTLLRQISLVVVRLLEDRSRL